MCLNKKNNIIKAALAAFFILNGLTGFSQQFVYNTATSWENSPVIHKVSAAFDSSAAVGILDEKQVEYKDEGKNVVVFLHRHSIVHVKDDKGIEMYNKVYVPVHDDGEITEIKARAIMPGGKVINIDADKIKDMEEEGSKYKIFAFDGVEKGAEVEYMYTEKRPFYLFGSEIFQSSHIPYQQAVFMLSTPQRLRFSVKGYNGYNVSKDTVINDVRMVAGYAQDVPEIDADEKYSFSDKYLKRVDYKFSYNLSGQSATTRLYTWKEFAKNAFSFYTNTSDKETKAVEGFIQQVNIPQDADAAAKIQLVEDYVKTNIDIDKKLITGDNTLVTVLKNKAASETLATRLFTAIFDKLGIEYQVVVAKDRTGISIDEEIENWNRADDILLYFPATDKFISPINQVTRYPYLPFNLTATRGLFLKGTVIGTFKTAVGSFDTIPMEPFSGNAHNMEAVVKFDESLDTLLISSRQLLYGYAAANYRPVFVYAPKDKQEEITKDIIKSVGNSLNITNIKVENSKLTDCATNKPLVISGDIKSTDMLENAGNKILLKIGEIIGQQVEMYQEKPRQLPVELPYPHVLDRKITIQLPEGYKVKNLNELNFDVSYKENDVVTLGFVSKYTQDGNTINLTINETYRNVEYPLSQFGVFAKVINASADFNKVVLVLEKAK